MTELELINEEEQRLLSRMRILIARRKEIKDAEFLLKYDVAIGDDVEYMNGKKLVIGKFVELKASYDHSAPIVTPYKKDGTVGNLRKVVYSWSLNTFKKHIKQ